MHPIHFQINHKQSQTIRVKGLSSRFSSKESKIQRTVAIQFKNNCHSIINSTWTCNCPSGLRTTSPCSHVVAILYKLMILERGVENGEFTDTAAGRFAKVRDAKRLKNLINEQKNIEERGALKESNNQIKDEPPWKKRRI